MRLRITVLCIAAGIVTAFASTRTLAAQRLLDITPIAQETPEWCWAASAEMIFRYYEVPTINPANDYQCGIAALVNPACAQNCLNCVVGAQGIVYMAQVLTRYPMVAAQLTGQIGRHISAIPENGPVSVTMLEAELDAGRPVLAGISPSIAFVPPGAPPQHAVVIVGYETDSDTPDDNPTLIVNDPYPFRATGHFVSPYEAAGGEMREDGQYAISYANFRQRLRWSATVWRIRCSGQACPDVSE